MTPPSTTRDDRWVQGTPCTGVRCPSVFGCSMERCAVLATADGRTIDERRWHPHRVQEVCAPSADPAWASRDVSALGLWLRRLTRTAACPRRSDHGDPHHAS
jgi:hypothetical protein